MIELSERDQKVLEAVITGYLRTGEPVGSRTIAKHYGMKVSSATIRNVMADLEEFGLLQQPYTSAGRIPTDKGLRFYLDSLIQLKKLKDQERAQIRKVFEQTHGDLEELLKQTSRILSTYCKQAGVVFWPKAAAVRFKHIQFVRLKPRQILAILISKGGLVRHSLVEWDEDITQEDLDKYSQYVDELLENIPLSQVRQRILEQMAAEKAAFDRLFTQALEIAQRAFQRALESPDVYIEGQTNLLDNPEFADIERLRKILKAFEDKSRLIRLLDMALKPQERVQIILGPESEVQELEEISLISSTYSQGDTVLGVLGVIGPLRMDYSRIIPIVQYTAESLSELLEEEACA